MIVFTWCWILDICLISPNATISHENINCTGVVAVPACNIVDDPEQMSMLHTDRCSSVVIVDDPELMLMIQCCNCYRVVVLNDLASVSMNYLRKKYEMLDM